MFMTVEDPDHYKMVIEADAITCPFHTSNPLEEHPNPLFRHGACGCQPTKFKRVRMTESEINYIKNQKRIKHEDEILAMAEAIKLQRASGEIG